MLSHLKENQCPQCRKISLVNDIVWGNWVCCKCGTVAEASMMDMTAEWRIFSDNGNGDGSGWKMARTGGAVNTLLTDEGLGTKVTGHNWLANLSVRLVSNEDNQIKRGITFILDLSTQIKMKESTMEQAKLLFSKIVKERVIRHKSMEAKVAAVLLAAHRMTNCSRPFKDIMVATGVKKKRDISHCYNAIRRLIPQEKHDEQVSDLV